MNLRRTLLLPASLLAALAFPGAVLAQQPAPPMAHPAMNCGESHGMMHRGMNPMRGINLTPQQRAQIKQLHEQFRAAHPCGSKPGPQAREQLRQQVMNILTPAQRAQFQANLQAMHAGSHPN